MFLHFLFVALGYVIALVSFEKTLLSGRYLSVYEQVREFSIMLASSFVLLWGLTALQAFPGALATLPLIVFMLVISATRLLKAFNVLTR